MSSTSELTEILQGHEKKFKLVLSIDVIIFLFYKFDMMILDLREDMQGFESSSLHGQIDFECYSVFVHSILSLVHSR